MGPVRARRVHDGKFLLFVSYSCDDARHPFLERLRGFGDLPDIAAVAEFFMAEDRPDIGADFIEKVRGALDRADAVLPFITGASRGSAWVNQEIGYAVARGTQLLPAFDRATAQYLKGMIQTMDACPVDDEAKVTALFTRIRTLASEPRTARGQELTLEFKGVWWSYIRGAFPMYLRFELTHASKEPDTVKQVLLECSGQSVPTEDTGKLSRLRDVDFQDVTLKFFPPPTGNAVQPIRIVVTTVRGKHAELGFDAAPSGWRPDNLWRDFVPY